MFNEAFKDNAGDQMLWNYFLFQFSRWEGAVLVEKEIGGGKILPTMIIGQKAFSKFVERDQTYDWTFFTSTPFTERYQIRRTDFEEKRQASHKEKITSQAPTIHRDPNKAAFLNTEDGIATCVELTSLYDELDVSCKKCKFKEECIVLLKEHYPKIYEKQYGQRESKIK